MTEKFVVTFDDALDVPQEVFDRMFAQYVEIVPKPKVVHDPWGDLMKREMNGARPELVIIDDPYDDVDWKRLFNEPVPPLMVWDRMLHDAVQKLTGLDTIADLSPQAMTNNVEPTDEQKQQWANAIERAIRVERLVNLR